MNPAPMTTALRAPAASIDAQHVGVGHGAQRAHLRAVEAGQRGHDRVGAGGEHQCVVVDLELGVGGEVADTHAAALAVDAHDLVPHADVEVERLAQRLRGVQEEVAPVHDLAAHVVRQAAVGERHVLPALEHDDLRGLVQAAQARCRRHPAGHSTHDHDLHDVRSSALGAL